ncbi:MAG: serine hydroxymethyltransferase [Candidatus Diapherotrites archaeon]
MSILSEKDPEVFKSIQCEKERQMDGIELIASENYVSEAVLEAMGSIMTNKYSEGYPGKRYYAGNECIDVAENLAIDRAKKLFNAEHVNVQPLSGSPANQAVYFALLERGDSFMGLDLDMGGHITHGLKYNFSGRYYDHISYAVDKETEMLDMDAIRKIAKEKKPKMILSGYTAYPRAVPFKEFREICDEVGAFCWADIAHIAGLCATGHHENPVPYFDVVTTTTHKTLRGPRAAIIMCKEEFAAKIDKAIFPGLQGGPHDHINAAKAVAFKEAMQPEFKEYAGQIIKNAKALGEELQAQGIRLVSGGTDNHLLLLDLTKTGQRAKHVVEQLDKAGICTNKNTIPYDTGSPWDPNGIRIGTPALTTRGMKESEMKQVGEWMGQVVKSPDDAALIEKVNGEVKELCKQFIIYK